jgi:hypothetical protein
VINNSFIFLQLVKFNSFNSLGKILEENSIQLEETLNEQSQAVINSSIMLDEEKITGK